MLQTAVAAIADHPDPRTQARQFKEQFTAKYGVRQPQWVEESWRQAATLAHQQFKFLLVYLHSPDHEDTDNYVRNVLCSPEVVDYINQQFVCWGGDVRKPDAFNLSGRLNISTYPCVALLAFSGSRTKLVAAAQGKVRVQQLMAALQRAVEDQGMLLMAEQLEQEERVSSVICMVQMSMAGGCCDVLVCWQLLMAATVLVLVCWQQGLRSGCRHRCARTIV